MKRRRCPFPSEDTTPPVTKMYLVAFGPVVIRPALDKRASGLPPVEGRRGCRRRGAPPRQPATPMLKPWCSARSCSSRSACSAGLGGSAPPSGPARRGCRHRSRCAASTGRRSGSLGSRRCGIGAREKYSARPPSIDHHLDPARDRRPAPGSSGAAAVPTSSPPSTRAEAPGQRLTGQKGLVALDVDHHSNPPNSGRPPPPPPGRSRSGATDRSAPR